MTLSKSLKTSSMLSIRGIAFACDISSAVCSKRLLALKASSSVVSCHMLHKYTVSEIQQKEEEFGEF